MTLLNEFTLPLLNWYDQHGRKDLPWQHPGSPYQIWVSEIMLQQTQVKTVIPYFERLMKTFPELNDLANAPEDAVFACWAGLGYYSRARNLHRTAKIISHDYQGIWPRTIEALSALPGIGRSTAAAIASQAFHQATAILDGNVKRVLCRYFMVEGHPEESQTKKMLWSLAEQCMSDARCKNYTQAIMDLGATCCTNRNPNCADCPVKNSCKAFQQERVHDFPFKKIRKKIPTRTQQFLLIHNQSKQIYLEKNPPSGIWGSLWSLPSLDVSHDPIDYLNTWTLFNEEDCAIQELLQFKHTFTHFHLQIHAQLVTIHSSFNQIRPGSTGQWFTQAEIQSLGLPKPIHQIIQNI